ncbi:NYN domain-containing protein [Pseudonocardia hispaniensis]|uniref:NYN domain-containing protein n=1 Tax=Pseudonocardia hispaniensis TaxID=904933 RepID=A0ABW1IY49_9PSEU
MYPDASPSPESGDASSPPEPGEAPAPDDADAARGAGPGSRGPDWDRLPDPVRGRLAEVAAVAVGGMPLSSVPVPLRRLAQFTPAKRARLGAGLLLAELGASTAFRAAVLAWWAEHRPGELDVHCAEALTAAAAAVLSGVPETDRMLAAAARRGEVAELRAERDAALARVDKLTAELERLRAELADAREQARCADQQRDAEFGQLRRRVSEQGGKLRAALDARAAAEAAVEQLRSSARAELAQALAARDRERARAEEERRRATRATREIAAARQAAREARQADEVRLGLLIDTLSGAVTGLRRELALGGGGPRPGDLVAGAHGRRAGAPVDDRAALDALLALPATHLVVDGYNVSKTGYPELPLADQRTRLVRQLGALAARTGVEITVVFDGAGVVTAPTRGSRGVRVLFSDAGVLADDVIRSLVAAEPEGRPVLVATSDRAVAESVRRRGAHALASAVLLDRLRG